MSLLLFGENTKTNSPIKKAAMIFLYVEWRIIGRLEIVRPKLAMKNNEIGAKRESAKF